ncbi:MAG: flagellar basal body L-ring protein FlgH [endosymbiont of Galathealinum brachiosum]|uniref:Flagellar L-ring protein n=1 Tax=endosymbiont of Galathealinum brachiosum TaxID=2200906 RepID=A0A370DIF3_9GAMM|nr:MAG: flagellar basal body L-ring protein FlgH [endosymbiont of Galathealinum brachiosum]
MKNLQLIKYSLLAIAMQSVSGCNVKPQELADFEPIVRPIAPKPMNYNSGSLFQERSISLYEDPKPYRIGDILTIILNEKTSASKKAGTSTKKEDEITTANPTLFGVQPTFKGNNVLEFSVAPEREFSGEADSSQSNSLTGEITVTVVDILPNGNLVVQGEKWFTLNQGKEYIRIAGVVRPLDVLADNTLPSSKLADAQIAYSGEGFLADANTQGWFGQFMNGKWWPF